jgi:hypothetical protein
VKDLIGWEWEDIRSHLDDEQRSQTGVFEMVEWTSLTVQGDEVMEWQDTEVSPAQHHVYLGREARGLPDISFHFETQEGAHTFYQALCRCKRAHVEGDEVS